MAALNIVSLFLIVFSPSVSTNGQAVYISGHHLDEKHIEVRFPKQTGKPTFYLPRRILQAHRLDADKKLKVSYNFLERFLSSGVWLPCGKSPVYELGNCFRFFYLYEASNELFEYEDLLVFSTIWPKPKVLLYLDIPTYRRFKKDLETSSPFHLISYANKLESLRSLVKVCSKNEPLEDLVINH